MPGLRITLRPGAPGIFPMCLKNMLDAKRVAYTLAIHPGINMDQSFLYELTSQRSMPIMLYNDEPPRCSWVQQVVLADKLGGSPSLIPEEPEERATMMGLMNELMGEDGLIWLKRILFGKNPMSLRYGYSEEAVAVAPAKIVKIWGIFIKRLTAQKVAGSQYLLGTSLTAVDIYLSTCSWFFLPPSFDLVAPTKETEGLLPAFANNVPEVQAIVDEHKDLIVEYRDNILKRHCITPSLIGGTPSDNVELKDHAWWWAKGPK